MKTRLNFILLSSCILALGLAGCSTGGGGGTGGTGGMSDPGPGAPAVDSTSMVRGLVTDTAGERVGEVMVTAGGQATTGTASKAFNPIFSGTTLSQ